MNVGLVLGVLLFGGFVDGKHDKGVLDTTENWHFLTRFCFRHDDNRLTYKFEYPIEYAQQQMYLYYDTEDQWPAAYETDTTCDEKLALLTPMNNQLLNLTTDDNLMWSQYEKRFIPEKSGCTIVMKPDGKKVYRCEGNRTFSAARSRWWYIAIGNCNSSKGVYMEYDLTMANGDKQYDWWSFQFSSDEIGILQTDIIFGSFDFLLLLLSALVALALRSRQMLHRTFKIFIWSLTLKCVSLLAHVIARTRYANDGIGSPTMTLVAKLCDASSSMIMICLLVVFAKGWTVTRGRLSKASGIRIIVFMVVFCTSYAALYIYQLRYFDPAKVLYLYESWAGHLIIVLRLIAWGWFVYACRHTMAKYPEKHEFYVRFVVVYSVWFLSGPAIILAGNYVLDNWVREKVANGIENAVAAVGYAWFLWLTRPSAANVHFPYHVRTGQIDAINDAADMCDGVKCATDLPHHAYQIKYTAEKDEVFTIASARSTDAGTAGREMESMPNNSTSDYLRAADNEHDGESDDDESDGARVIGDTQKNNTVNM